ncbi:MAG: hypothetical protein ABSH20_02745 [Tepidisphaeraceae bacterium]
MFCQRAMAAGTDYDVDLGAANFGHLNQSNSVPGGVGPDVPNPNPPPSFINNYCAPTSTMNSFTFLQKTYPNVYGNNNQLQGGTGSWTAAAQALAGLAGPPLYMNTDPNTGTTENNWVDGKVAWLEKYAPGKTIYEGEDTLYTGTQAWVDTKTKPTANFLYDMLKAGEDVEIGLSPTVGNGIGHVMTLTSIHWNDADNSGTFNAGDTLQIDGIDPGNPGFPFLYTLNPADASGFMTFKGGDYNTYRLDAALAESPVPLPAAVWGGILLLSGLVARRRYASLAS